MSWLFRVEWKLRPANCHQWWPMQEQFRAHLSAVLPFWIIKTVQIGSFVKDFPQHPDIIINEQKLRLRSLGGPSRWLKKSWRAGL